MTAAWGSPAAWGLAIDVASFLCLGLGAFFCVVGGVGLLRLPDLYSRTHGASVTDTLGAGLVLAGLMLQAGPTQTALKLALVLAFMFASGPAAAHALVKAAYAQGLKAQLSNPPGDQNRERSSAS